MKVRNIVRTLPICTVIGFNLFLIRITLALRYFIGTVPVILGSYSTLHLLYPLYLSVSFNVHVRHNFAPDNRVMVLAL